MGEVIWVLLLFALHFIAPVVLVIGAVGGFLTLRRMSREIKSLKASRGDAAAMELERLRLKGRLLGILSVILGIAAFVVAAIYTESPTGSAIAAAVCFLPLWIRSLVLKRRYNDSFKENFVAIELSKVFDNLQYRPGGWFPGDEITALDFFSHIDAITGSDLIEADYQGVRFRQSDLTVNEVWTETETDDDGHTREEVKTRRVFSGRVMKFDFADAFRGDVQVISRDFDGARVSGASAEWQSVETELAELGERFRVLARDQLDAMAALTPQMIEGIYYLERAVNVPVAFYFRGNSMYAFLSLDHDAFEATAQKTLLEARRQLSGDIKIVTDFLETMYFKRQEGDEPLRRRRNMPMAAPSLVANLTRQGKRVTSFFLVNFGRLLFAVYAVSAVYTLVKLPDGIVLSTDINSETAISASPFVYIAVLTVFMLPLLGRRSWLKAITVSGLLLLIHFLFLSANLGG
ncbi:MAG: DUF3137 domain-containing protein [Candidatus Adiutrix sp.]|jgi:hypothetical protein|nr:DUF3137 domain-containing protein [Candidatus Adiutrix sp.]